MGGFLVPASSMAQMLCGPYAEIARVLENDYQEQKVAGGLSNTGALVELFVADRRSWTIVFTIPGGPSCVLGGGESWEVQTPRKPREES
jgi:hypothetical protein